MGDRTYYRLALPADLDREAVRMAAIAFTDGPWTDDDVTRLLDNSRPDQPLWVDIEERSVGACRDAAEAVLTALREEGQDVAFTVTEDPKYEWLGTLCRYQPGKGMHEVDCDANAQAVLTDGELTVLIRTLTDPAAILDRITARLGLDWQTPAAA
jgi:hypothetical protein